MIARVPVAVDAAAGKAVVLIGRMNADGMLDIVAQFAGSEGDAIASRALRGGRAVRAAEGGMRG